MLSPPLLLSLSLAKLSNITKWQFCFRVFTRVFCSKFLAAVVLLPTFLGLPFRYNPCFAATTMTTTTTIGDSTCSCWCFVYSFVRVCGSAYTATTKKFFCENSITKTTGKKWNNLFICSSQHIHAFEFDCFSNNFSLSLPLTLTHT